MTGIRNAKIFSKLRYLTLFDNEFEGEFTVNEENFPTYIFGLNLRDNKITDIRIGKSFTNLRSLYLQNNEFKGEYVITKENFLLSLYQLYLDGNVQLTSIDAEENAVPNLQYLSFNRIEEIIVKQELCERGDITSCDRVDPLDFNRQFCINN